MNFRQWILLHGYPIVRLIAKCDLPVTRLTTPKDLDLILSVIQPADVLLTRKRFSLAAEFISGFWSHAALALERPGIVEAVTTGVRVSTVDHLLAGADYVMVVRPTFLHAGMMTAVCQRALSAVGKPYDFLFDPGLDALYCAELITYAFAESWQGEGECPWIQRDVAGILTSYPQDFASSRKFAKVCGTGSLKGIDENEYYPGAKKLERASVTA